MASADLVAEMKIVLFEAASSKPNPGLEVLKSCYRLHAFDAPQNDPHRHAPALLRFALAVREVALVSDAFHVQNDLFQFFDLPNSVAKTLPKVVAADGTMPYVVDVQKLTRCEKSLPDLLAQPASIIHDAHGCAFLWYIYGEMLRRFSGCAPKALLDVAHRKEAETIHVRFPALWKCYERYHFRLIGYRPKPRYKKLPAVPAFAHKPVNELLSDWPLSSKGKEGASSSSSSTGADASGVGDNDVSVPKDPRNSVTHGLDILQKHDQVVRYGVAYLYVRLRAGDPHFTETQLISQATAIAQRAPHVRLLALSLLLDAAVEAGADSIGEAAWQWIWNAVDCCMARLDTEIRLADVSATTKDINLGHYRRAARCVAQYAQEHAKIGDEEMFQTDEDYDVRRVALAVMGHCDAMLERIECLQQERHLALVAQQTATGSTTTSEDSDEERESPEQTKSSMAHRLSPKSQRRHSNWQRVRKPSEYVTRRRRRSPSESVSPTDRRAASALERNRLASSPDRATIAKFRARLKRDSRI